MGEMKVEFPLSAMDRIIRKSGAKRVSESAALALAEVLEEKALLIAGEAARLAGHAGRRTVRDVDVRLAAKRV